MMARLRLRLYHLDVLACDAIVATYFLRTEKLKLKGDALTDGVIDGEEGRVWMGYSSFLLKPL
jgi:hypothetical protein